MIFADRFTLFRDKLRLLFQSPAARPKRGVAIYTPNSAETDLAHAIFRSWQAWMQSPAVQSQIKIITKRRTILEAPLVVQGRTFLVKVYVYRDIPRILEKLTFAGDARRNFATLCFLEKLGLIVSPPRCLILEKSCGLTKRAFVITEKIPAAVDYKEFMSSMDDQPEEKRHSFFLSLGKALAKLHNLDVATRDTDKNVMVEPLADGFRFHFLDFDCVYPWVTPNLRRTTRTIRKFLTPGHRFAAQDITAFVESYLKTRGRPDWKNTIFTECTTYLQTNAHRYKN